MTKTSRIASLGRIAPMLLLAGVAATNPELAGAYTADETVLRESCTLLGQIKDWLFGVVYVLGAIGLVLIAVSAFLGRFKFQHLIALGGGLFIVAAADLLIDFIAGGNEEDCVTG